MRSDAFGCIWMRADAVIRIWTLLENFPKIGQKFSFSHWDGLRELNWPPGDTPGRFSRGGVRAISLLILNGKERNRDSQSQSKSKSASKSEFKSKPKKF